MTNLEIADALDRLADLLQVERENPFKVRAFRRAARSVEGHPVAMEALIDGGGDPSSLPGVGREIAKGIRELGATGKAGGAETMGQGAAPAAGARVAGRRRRPAPCSRSPRSARRGGACCCRRRR